MNDSSIGKRILLHAFGRPDEELQPRPSSGKVGRSFFCFSGLGFWFLVFFGLGFWVFLFWFFLDFFVEDSFGIFGSILFLRFLEETC